MNDFIFRSKSGNNYFFSEKCKMIIYLSNKYLADMNRESSYSSKKKAFFMKYGLFDTLKPQLVSTYAKNTIKGNLANLRMLLIEVTDECNLACKYCGYRDLYNNYDERYGKKQDFNNVKALIDYLNKLWQSNNNLSYNTQIVVGFYGGEPLLCFSLIRKIIEYLESLEIDGLSFQYNMTTNAVLLNKYMDYLVDKEFRLLISLDGNRNNNAYRITKYGSESFEVVNNNILLMKKKYPNYFEKYVQFNSVLHNKNSMDDIYNYINDSFDKIPTVAELNTNGVAEDKKEEFNLIFKNKIIKTHQNNHKTLDTRYLLENSNLVKLNNFVRTFVSNIYDNYADLFIDENKQKYIPTGTCEPFGRKLFFTVNGKILPCERIGHGSPIAFVKNGIVDIDYNYVKEVYSKTIEALLPQCEDCLLWKNCSYCVFLMPEINGRKKCDRYLSFNKVDIYFSYYISYIENNTFLYEKIMNEINID